MSEFKVRKRGSGRIAALGTGGVAMAIMALMLLAPLSAGVVIIPAKKLGATVSYGVSTGACSHAHQAVAPHWAAATGQFKTAGSAISPSCPPGPSQNYGQWDAQLGLSAVLHFKTGTSHNITVAWKITMASAWTATPYTSCALNYKIAISECLVTADAEVFGYAYLYDQNNGSYFNFGSYVTMSNYTTVENYSQNYCYAGTCTHYGGNYSFGGPSGSFSGTFMQNSTIGAFGTYAVNNVDSYQLYIVLFALADAEAIVEGAKATGHGSASASVNMGTLGLGAQLVSVTVA